LGHKLADAARYLRTKPGSVHEPGFFIAFVNRMICLGSACQHLCNYLFNIQLDPYQWFNDCFPINTASSLLTCQPDTLVSLIDKNQLHKEMLPKRSNFSRLVLTGERS
jgi:hypothetical protein